VRLENDNTILCGVTYESMETDLELQTT
jgi:hypothetical protein